MVGAANRADQVLAFKTGYRTGAVDAVNVNIDVDRISAAIWVISPADYTIRIDDFKNAIGCISSNYRRFRYLADFNKTEIIQAGVCFPAPESDRMAATLQRKSIGIVLRCGNGATAPF